jgi:death on curing protein
MKYLSGEEILVIHAKIIDETGGSHGIRDIGLFQSIVEKPKMKFGGKELYPGVFTKAGTYLESLAKFHVFVDGNKRTAFAASARFLFLNNYHLVVANKEVVNFMLQVATKKLELKTIAAWLKKHIRRI